AENGIATSDGDIKESYNKIVEETNLSGNEIYLKVDFKFNDVDTSLNSSYNIDKANFYYSYDGASWTKIGNELSMSYDLKLFTGYRSAIYSYATKTTGGYADIDFFDYERADWNQPTIVQPNDFGWYFNNGFESDAEGWTNRGSTTVSSSSQESYVGNSSLYVTGRTAAWMGAQKALSPSTFKPGTEYSFSVNVKYTSGGATDTFYLKLQYVDASGDTQYAKIAESTAIKGEWVQLANANYKIPSDASNVYLYVETADSTNSFYLDEAIGAVGGMGIVGAGSQTINLGDVNLDGMIDCFDIAYAKRGYFNSFYSSAAQIAADVDQSGIVDETDIKLIQDFVLAKITKFPVAETVTPPKNNPWDDYQETASAEIQKFYSDSIYQIGNTARLRDKIEKAQNGDNVTLAYIGGSITEGGRTDTCYVSRSYRYFAETFGTGNNVSLINAGLSGTSSVVGLMRAQNDILDANPDVIFIEFSVNDHPEMIYKKGYESLVKKCLSQPNNPAV
ncbi:MAG: carbohydrate binding domain-containing protein, partial [Oscillospiraceae bacterium]|nr:carbohydrate binding domain-containing protein [Oscillospiraceae bacterium]